MSGVSRTGSARLLVVVADQRTIAREYTSETKAT
ncbi:hypothetical protein QFZ63_006520 [Streptomyces sp. B3I7]|nr:hypothetical protein [Streptomyces sp. B3I7]